MELSEIMNWWKTKTFWAGASGIVAAAGGWATGEISVGVALQTVVTSIMGILLRLAIAKEPEMPAPPLIDGVEKAAPVERKAERKWPESGGA